MADRILDSINNALRAEIAAIAEEEVAAAQKRVAQRVHDKLAEIAIRVFAHVDVSRQGEGRIVIEVKDKVHAP